MSKTAARRFLLPFAAAVALAGPALAENVQFDLVNNTSLTLMEFYASPITNPNWGDDILGSEVLAPGESGTVTIPNGSDYCQYDVQFVMEDGSLVEEQADVCVTHSFIVQ